MKLFHITLHRSLASILRRGLDPSRATGKRKCVWFATAGHVKGLIGHLSRHHKTPVVEMYVLTIDLPRVLLRRQRAGVYVCDSHVRPGKIGQVREAYDITRGAIKL
jgi:hypothetical protein